MNGSGSGSQLTLQLGVFPSFTETQRYWYGVLRASGFRDAECGYVDGALRTQVTVGDRVSYEARSEYYRLASYWARWGRFPSPLERLIWSLHAEGHTMREIAASASVCAMAAPRRVYLHDVHATIARHRRRMLARAQRRNTKPDTDV